VVNEVGTIELYKAEIAKSKTSGRLLVFDFYAPYSRQVCEPVRQILANIVDEDPSSIRVVRVNIDQCDSIREKAGVTNLPAVHIWFEGCFLESIAGKKVPSELRELIFLSQFE
jgi:thioredoxin-like negative regulator of GroEL